MFNLKAGGFAAVLAFVLSFLIGLVSRASMPTLILRPLIFAVVFFAIAGLVRFLAGRFLPELLHGGAGEETPLFPGPGSRIDITEGDDFPAASGGGQVFMGAQPDDSEEGLGNITGLLSKSPAPPVPAEVDRGSAGMDQNSQNGYNKGGIMEELSAIEQFPSWEPLPLDDTAASGETVARSNGASSAGEPQETAAPKTALAGAVENSGSMDFLPDLESMAGAFMPVSAEEEQDTTDYSISAPPPKLSRSKKAAAWPEDFNAKDMASGLRTVLNKEKEG